MLIITLISTSRMPRKSVELPLPTPSKSLPTVLRYSMALQS